MAEEVQHFVTLYARSAEEIAQAKRSLTDTNKTEWNDWEKAPAENNDFAESPNLRFRDRVWAQTLIFNFAGKENFRVAKASAEKLAEDIRSNGMGCLVSPDELRAQGWGKGFAQSFILGSITG